jgi:predicted transcriptional regulator
MIERLETVIGKVRQLSEERQHMAADLLEGLVAAGGDLHELTAEEERLINEGLADLEAGRVVSEDEMVGFWNRHRA